MIPSLAFLALLQDAAPVHPDLAELSGRWEQAMEACGVSALGMVLVEGDGVVHRATLGRRDPARDAPVTEDTIFYIASATKPYVAFELARLAEAGAVDLDAPVKRYLPRFALADAALAERITVRDLLCHRHGLDSQPIVLLDAYTGEITEDRFYHFLPEVEAAGRVGYSNLHFTLAGRVIEAVSGKSWRDSLAEHVFAPAGMTRTTGYADWMYAQDDVAIPAEYVAGRAVATARKSDRTMHAAGGLGTTLADLARWLRIQLGRGEIDGRRLLSPEATEATWELQSDARNSDFGVVDGFALGWQRGRYREHVMLRHSGGYVGAASHVCFLPELGLGIAVVATGGAGGAGLCELVSTDVLERLLADDEIRDVLPRLLARAEEARARDEARRSAGGPPELRLSLPLERYAGTYRDPWFGTLTIESAAGGLRARLGELPLALSTPAPDVLRIDGSGPVGGEAALEIAGGRVEAIALELGGAVRFVR